MKLCRCSNNAAICLIEAAILNLLSATAALHSFYCVLKCLHWERSASGWKSSRTLRINVCDQWAPCFREWRKLTCTNEAMPLLNCSCNSRCFGRCSRSAWFLLHFEMFALKTKCLRLEFIEKTSIFCLRLISALFCKWKQLTCKMKLCGFWNEAAIFDVLSAAASLHGFHGDLKYLQRKRNCLRFDIVGKIWNICAQLISTVLL